MQKKHQIFISSTFSDLKDERQAAVESILSAGHIPAGMELFAAGDESQMEVIKHWIDDSDIYMLILGGRYGSIDSQSNLSYTEIEYNYALEKGKPFFSLVLTDEAIDAKAEKLNGSYREIDNQNQYNQFRKKVLSKISKLVEDSKDVKIGVMESIRHLETKYTLHGWIRSNDFPDVAPLITQLSSMSEENSSLKKKLDEMPVTSLNNGEIELAGLDDEVHLEIEYKPGTNYSYRDYSPTLTWGKLFGLISPELLSGKNDAYMQRYIAEQVLDLAEISSVSHRVKEQSFQTIKIHFMALKLISINYSGTMQGGAALFWNLTSAGKNTLVAIRSIKKIN